MERGGGKSALWGCLDGLKEWSNCVWCGHRLDWISLWSG